MYNTESFIKKAREIHGDKYDYSKVEYRDCYENILIICPEHGEFWQKPYKHLHGNGCPKCYFTNKFIQKAKKVHGDKYDYSKVDYVNCATSVRIICPEHGEFFQIPANHIQGCGCPNCALGKPRKPRYDTETFIDKSKKVHGDKYDYSKTEYKDCKTKVLIICKEHGPYYQFPGTHLQGCGCPSCGKEVSIKSNCSNTSKFIEKAKKIHGDKYDYSETEYTGWDKEVKIICKKHGEFHQKAIYHIKGRGCPECGKEKSIDNKKFQNNEDFIAELKKVHGDKYDYSKVVYKNSNTRIQAICPEHGEFSIFPNQFLNGKECPECEKERYKAVLANTFLEKAKKKFQDTYDYSKMNYVNKHTPICIIHPIYGEFWQTPEQHLDSKTGYNISIRRSTQYTYDYCFSVASKYKDIFHFQNLEKKVYSKAKKNGWIKDYHWLENLNYFLNEPMTEETNGQFVYVYEFPDNSAYVGLTNNILRRDLQHRIKRYETNGSVKYDGVLFHSVNFNIPIPNVKILKEGLTRKESQIEERRYIKEYKKNGWNVLNKNDGGSLGSIPHVYFKKEDVIAEAKKYKSLEEMRRNNRSAYNFVKKKKLEDVCFPNRIKYKVFDEWGKKREYTEDFLKEIKEKYPLKKDLRKNDAAAYRWLYKNNRLYEFYPSKDEK